jgi:putative endonuclease
LRKFQKLQIRNSLGRLAQLVQSAAPDKVGTEVAMKYSVYILYSKALVRYYIGSTSNIEYRLQQHNKPHKRYTNSGQPWIIVYSEQFDSKKEALIRERFIKEKKSKKFIRNLIDYLDA